MILRVYAINDAKAAAYTSPFFLGRDEAAVRAFRDALSDPQHPMARHPEDYELFFLGEFDDETGRIDPADRPVFLCNGNGEMIKNG